ncbi:MAG: acyl-CoA thioesterase [Chitinophagaceae bacterium]|nr:acyl-CoA thioesterase [Chitinophagaceae bacterium]
MARIKLELPETFSFSCEIPVRITDVNYGGHVGNDTILSIIHEARIRFLKNLGYSEMDFDGKGMIMADAAIEFKNELFYGDTVLASVTAGDISKIGFELYYKLEKETEGIRRLIATAKTGMICYDYEKKKIIPIPEEAKESLHR